MYSAYIRLKFRKVIIIVALWPEFQGEDFNSSLCSLDVSFSGAEYLKIHLNLAVDNVKRVRLVQLLELLKILPAEYLSSMRVLEVVLVTWKDSKFALFWSRPWISWALWMNKFLVGEIRVFL